jgi:hypothetical protein
MIRTALRLATLAALTGFGRTPWPTLAGGNVYDSRKDDISEVVAEERMPVLVIRTDEDRSITRDRRSGMPSNAPVARQVLLRIEASVMAATRDSDGNVFFGWPATDSGLEAMLDLLEWQVYIALTGKSPTALWWQDEWVRGLAVEQIDSMPLFMASDEGKVRMAVRELTYALRLPFDSTPPALREDQVTIVGGQPVLANALPDYLRAVFDAIEARGDDDLKVAAAELRASLETQDLPKPSVHPRLTKVIAVMPEAFPPEGEDPATQFEADFLGDMP